MESWKPSRGLKTQKFRLLKKSKLLVTGASGFLGRNFLLSHFSSDFEVTAQYNSDSTFLDWVGINCPSVTIIKADLINEVDLLKLKQLGSHFDVCLYLAANGDPAVSALEVSFDLERNTLMLVKLLENFSFSKFIYFSSGAVYDGLVGKVNTTSPLKPLLPYSISKLTSERYIEYFSKKRGSISRYSIVRFFGAYGPYEASRKIYGRLVKNFGIDRNPNFVIRGDGKNYIDAMYVADTIFAIWLIIKDDHAPALFDLTSANPITLSDLVLEAGKAFEIEPIIDYQGEVPEYIAFQSNCQIFKNHYSFVPRISLNAGFTMFYDFIKSDDSFRS